MRTGIVRSLEMRAIDAAPMALHTCVQDCMLSAYLYTSKNTTCICHATILIDEHYFLPLITKPITHYLYHVFYGESLDYITKFSPHITSLNIHIHWRSLG